MGEKEEGMFTLIGGDFNARTGKREKGIGEEEEEGGRGIRWRERKSKDEKENKEERKLLEFIEERGWGILNGSTKGMKKGN
jgi:hypothetical protein